MKKAVFAGSFDPFTLGHKDIVVRASKLFDEVIVAVARDNGKSSHALDDRRQIASLSLKGIDNVKVVTFDGLLTDFMKSVGGNVLLRGVRMASDFEYEKSLQEVYRSLYKDIEFVLFPAKAELVHISSTVVRELAKLNCSLDGYVDHGVEKIVADLYGAQQ